MEITVRLYGTLRRFSSADTPGIWRGSLPQGSRLVDLLEVLGTSEAELANAAINGEIVPLESEIPPDAEVTLVTPVGGG
jgi:sulfur carrier protein ThiS